MKVLKIKRKDLARALALLLAGGSGMIGCSSHPKTGLNDVALARAMNGDHKIVSSFARCETQYDVLGCKQRALRGE